MVFLISGVQRFETVHLYSTCESIHVRLVASASTRYWYNFRIVTRSLQGILIWVCLKMEYTPNYSHLVGILIINHWVSGYTIFRQTHIHSHPLPRHGRTALYVGEKDRPMVGPKPTFRIDLPAGRPGWWAVEPVRMERTCSERRVWPKTAQTK